MIQIGFLLDKNIRALCTLSFFFGQSRAFYRSLIPLGINRSIKKEIVKGSKSKPGHRLFSIGDRTLQRFIGTFVFPRKGKTGQCETLIQ